MKVRLIILIFCFGFLNNALGQVSMEEKNQSPQELYDFHIKKKKKNKTNAWVALGGGVAMITGGIVINLSENIFDNSNKGLGLVYFGVATTLASIPLFISASKHKNKAKIHLQNGAVGYENKIHYSGISLTFSF